jgi:hypothetical protein
MAFFFFSESLCGAKNRESDSLTNLPPACVPVIVGIRRTPPPPPLRGGTHGAVELDVWPPGVALEKSKAAFKQMPRRR